MSRAISALIAEGLLISAVCLSGTSQAAESSYYKAEISKATDQFKIDKQRCSTLKGNDEDVCKKRATANLKIAEADLKAYEENTTAAGIKAHKEKIDQNYAVDKEKCDDYKGNTKDICVAEADAVKSRREGNLKALEARLDGYYKVAVEKCENLAGDKRSACKDEAKRAYKP